MAKEIMPFQRQGWLLLHFLKRGIRPDRKSAMGKEYWVLAERDLSHIELPPFTPKSLEGAPIPYEVQYNLDNAWDCIDWIRDNEMIIPTLSLTALKQSATVLA